MMPQIQNARSTKKLSTLCKVAGGGLILLSFVVQNYSYDLWNTRLTEYMNATRDFAALQRSSVGYQNLYLQPGNTMDEKTKEVIIQKAAKTDLLSRKILHEANGDQNDEHEIILGELSGEVSQVKNMAAFQVYLNKAGNIDEFSLQEEKQQVNEDSRWKLICRNIFLVTYVIGSLILLFGFRYE